MTETETELEFVDRYTGTPMEHRPWLRGCFGDCEAMGYFPTPDPREWPIMSRPWPSHPEVGTERLDYHQDVRFLYVGPDWSPRGDVRLISEPDDPDWRAALIERGWWIPRSAKDDGWAFLKCPECNASGTVSYWAGIKRLPFLWGKTLRSLRNLDGSEGWPPSVKHPKLRTGWFYFTYGVKETWRVVTWRAPESLR